MGYRYEVTGVCFLRGRNETQLWKNNSKALKSGRCLSVGSMSDEGKILAYGHAKSRWYFMEKM